jgi:predicted AAA+ superfamily ATPase
LRDEDRGPLWEHVVLDILRVSPGARGVAYWRDKAGREIDFVVLRGDEVDAIECKSRPDRMDRRNLDTFREAYPRGRNLVVAPGVTEPYDFSVGRHVVRAVGCDELLSVYH